MGKWRDDLIAQGETNLDVINTLDRHSAGITFSPAEIQWGVMYRNYHSDQAALADGLFFAAASIYAPWTTASYALISDVTGTQMSREGLLMSVGISKAMSPAVNYLGHGSSTSKAIWEHNAWWLGNGVGFVPVVGD